MERSSEGSCDDICTTADFALIAFTYQVHPTNKIEEAKAEHAQLGEEHLDAIIEHSTQALHARQIPGTRGSRSVSSLHDSDTPENSESDVDDAFDEDEVEGGEDDIGEVLEQSAAKESWRRTPR